MRGKNTSKQVHAALLRFLSDPGQWEGSLSGSGAVYRLEKRFSSLVGLPHALAVANATLGLWALFMALEIHDADVITTPYTWGGSLAGLALSGNRPVFADIDRNTLTLDPVAVGQRVTPRTRAMLAVDIYGYPCDGPTLRQIADYHGLVLIQDCAQSFGAYQEGHHTGWWADAAVFSFTRSKALFAGEGGMILTPHSDLWRALVRQTQHPLRQIRDVPGSPVNEMAVNLRINPLAAVWAEATWNDTLAGMDKHRIESLRILDLLEKEKASKTKAPDGKKVRPSFHTLTFEPRCKSDRIQAVLRDNHLSYTISSPPVSAPIYYHDSYRELSKKCGWGKHCKCPVAEEQSNRRVRLVKEKER